MKMLSHRLVPLKFIVCAIILCSYVDTLSLSRVCNRRPEGTGSGRSKSPGTFRIRIADDSTFYTPGRQYTIYLEKNRRDWYRSSARQQSIFTGFILAVETKSNITDSYSQEFSPDRQGIFKANADDTLTKLICGNVVTHTSDVAKNDISINWTAPGPGQGCVTFRATIIETRDFWYMDDYELTKDFCEDPDQGSSIDEMLEECTACHEAKYELTFEGLWSRNTHPKGYPGNGFTAKFGDIIGATHKFGRGFWSHYDFASDGLKQVAETGSTQTLEAELKNMSADIRTIIKARGLYPPTGKTFAVFRVDSENHLVSLVSMISPSPDWFVGVKSLELCQPGGTWKESQVVDLYPWDAGTDKGTNYDSPDQESRPPEYIKRITSESPNNVDSPFYNRSGSKMKPLARLTLLRQRLYEKNCTTANPANDDCLVSRFSNWGECTGAICGSRGKQYRQRYCKNPDKATKCNRKLFETKTCNMPRCTYEEEEEYVPTEDDCIEKSTYIQLKDCSPSCKKYSSEISYRELRLKYTDRSKTKECQLRDRRPKTIREECEDVPLCNDQDQGDNGESKTSGEEDDTGNKSEKDEETTEGDISTEQPKIVCTFKGWVNTSCSVPCGIGTLTSTREPHIWRHCEKETKTLECDAGECRNERLCTEELNFEGCEETELNSFASYDADQCKCVAFSSNCKKLENTNMFDTMDECRSNCPLTEGCSKRNKNRPNRYHRKH